MAEPHAVGRRDRRMALAAPRHPHPPPPHLTVPARRCLDCRTLTTATRCPACQAQRKQQRNAAAPQARDLVAAWRAEHGDWCPGYQRDPHPAGDLTADHHVPLSANGEATGPNLNGVLCRSCNARKGGRV